MDAHTPSAVLPLTSDSPAAVGEEGWKYMPVTCANPCAAFSHFGVELGGVGASCTAWLHSFCSVLSQYPRGSPHPPPAFHETVWPRGPTVRLPNTTLSLRTFRPRGLLAHNGPGPRVGRFTTTAHVPRHGVCYGYRSPFIRHRTPETQPSPVLTTSFSLEPTSTSAF